MADPNLCNNCRTEGKWLPTSIPRLEAYLGKFMAAGLGVPNVVGLRKNLAYNIQYLQFQRQMLSELDVTQVILTQVWKMHIIVGTSIVEALLYFLITSKNEQKVTEWKEIGASSSDTLIKSKRCRIETKIFEKLDTPEPAQMTLDVMAKKAENLKLLGDGPEIYKKLSYLRKLRNRVHIHAITADQDTDWWKINRKEVDTLRLVLYSFLTSSLFDPTNDEKKIFAFLRSDA